jgi:hypothetical protein
MAVLLEMHHTGDPALRAEVVAAIEHVFADRPGEWRVSIIGSQANDRWEMKIGGPKGFERSYTLGRQFRGTSAGDLGYCREYGAREFVRGWRVAR